MTNINELLRTDILGIQNPYQLPNENTINLSLMESPFDLPDEVKQQSSLEQGSIKLNHYPDHECQALTNAISSYFDISDGQILLGSGLMPIIQNICWAFSKPGEYVLTPSPSFFMFRRFIRQAHMTPIEIPLLSDFNIDTVNFIAAIKTYKPKIIFIDNPNNPTGKLFKPEDILQILNHATGVVVIDEAYFPYAQQSFIDKLSSYKNLIILRTLSKIGLAALRVGFLIANTEIAYYLSKALPPFRINSLSQSCAITALQNKPVIENNTKEIISLRNYLLQELSKIQGIKPFESDANFILFKTEPPSSLLLDHLNKNSILINTLDGTHELLRNCLRVAIGNKNEISAFLTETKICMKNLMQNQYRER